MIIDQSIVKLINLIETQKLDQKALSEALISLLNKLYVNTQKIEVKKRYSAYFANTYMTDNPAAHIAKYPIDKEGYAVAYNPLTQEQEFWDAWVKYGVTVSKQNISSHEANAAIQRIAKIIAAVSLQQFDISDPRTYENMPVDYNNTPFISRGFLEVYHDDMLAQLRQSLRIYIHNVIIWGRVDLWTTFDRLGVKLPDHQDAVGLPLHVDQNPLVHPKFHTVQGVLAFVDCPKERGTLVVVPGSRALFSKYSDVVVKSNPDYRGEYIQLDLEQPFAKILQAGYQVLPLRKGCYASWDSRTTHANTTNISNETRYVAYISARPANDHIQSAVRDRTTSFTTGLGANNREAAMHASKKPRYTMQELLQSVRKPERLTLLGELLYGKRSYWPLLEQRSNLRLLLNAEPFGYGPAAAMADFYRVLRNKFAYIAVVGNDHTLDLLPAGYDARYDIAQLAARDLTIEDILLSHDIFFTALDFAMAQKAVDLNVPTVIYDSLTWYWQEINPVIKSPKVLYIAQNFLGVEQRIKDNPNLFGRPFIIPPIIQSIDQTKQTHSDKQIVLLNFGGLTNTYFTAEVLCAYVSIIYKAVKTIMTVGQYDLVVVGNTQFTQQIGGRKYSRDEMKEILPQVKLVIATSGLGNLYESAMHNIPTICLPESNDSQGIQARLLRDNDRVDAAISWQDLGIEIDYCKNQEVAMACIDSAIRRLMTESELQEKLHAALAAAFKHTIVLENSKIATLINEFGANGIEYAVNAIQAFAANIFASQQHRKYFRLAGGFSLVLNFKTEVDTKHDEILLQARVPGLEWGITSKTTSTLYVNPAPSENLANVPLAQIVKIPNLEQQGLSGDIPHLIYAMARKAWLTKNLSSVHAACIGSPETGFALIVGHPGAGKSSTALQMTIRQGWQLFSGDTTLVQFMPNSKTFEAIGGTKVMTLRNPDRYNWPEISDKQGEFKLDRFVFCLAPAQYCFAQSVAIKSIVLLNLNDSRNTFKRMEPASALHSLYKFFLDTERADVLLQHNGYYDGTVSEDARRYLRYSLESALTKTPVYEIHGSMEKVTANIASTLNILPPANILPTYAKANNSLVNVLRPKQVLFGICGLGNGHTFRQLPIINSLLEQKYRVIIFAYGNSLKHFTKTFVNNTQVKIFPVANEFIVGDSRGLNFALSAEHPQNQQAFSALNLQAMAAADELGLIDCVVSDYEYVSAQYARSRKIKQITIDQQSKFFLPGFPKDIDGLAYLDEVQRLQMFFPDAYQRIALSFFKPQECEQYAETPVTLLPPILRPEILNAKGLTRFSKRTIMIYMSSMYQIDLDAIQSFTSTQLHTNFIVFLPPEYDLPADFGNLKFMAYADFDFMLILSRCHGIIAAAGHSLLAEAMYLGIPVLAVPAHIYEQQLNAKVIGDNGFGINCKGDLTAEILNHFLLQLDQFRSNIESDRGKILLLGTDASNLINIIKGVAEHMEVSHHDDRTRSGSTSSISRIGRRII